MTDSLLPAFADFLAGAAEEEISNEIARPTRLRIADGKHGQRQLTVAYAPFDYVSRSARVMFVGLTPGRHQMEQALMEARRLLRAGRSLEDAAIGAKVHASFSGPMRENLVAMLDYVGLAGKLGLGSTRELWGGASHLAHFTSALRYPVFVDGANYSGTPDMLSSPFLREQLMRWLPAELAILPNAVVVPLGPKVAKAAEAAAGAIGLDRTRVLSGIPHPSGANAERIAFFLDRKPRASLSNKVAPETIIQGRAAVRSAVAQLGGLV